MTQQLEALTRPNGSIYRPRKLRVEPLWDEDEGFSALVLGTHDIELAAPIAQEVLYETLREFGQEPSTVDIESAKTGWWRKDLDRFEDGEPRYCFWPDESTGAAGVRFDLVREGA